jgi:hypothetical protein
MADNSHNINYENIHYDIVTSFLDSRISTLRGIETTRIQCLEEDSLNTRDRTKGNCTLICTVKLQSLIFLYTHTLCALRD